MRIRIRRRIIRIRVADTCIRTIIRRTAEQHTPTTDNPFISTQNLKIQKTIRGVTRPVKSKAENRNSHSYTTPYYK